MPASGYGEPAATAVERPKADTLAVGLERELEFTVAGRLVTDVGGSIGVAVLSTPGMVAMIERNCALLALAHLPKGKATVGFEICVKHVAGALEGARCVTHARLREIADGRKLRFDVEVRERGGTDEADRTVGVGMHERRVVDVAGHARVAGR